MGFMRSCAARYTKYSFLILYITAIYRNPLFYRQRPTIALFAARLRESSRDVYICQPG